MTTIKTNGGRVVLTDFREKQRSAGGALDIELSTGDVITVDPPALWTDEVVELAAAGKIKESAHLLLGDDWDRFAADGGTAMILNAIIGDYWGGSLGK